MHFWFMPNICRKFWKRSPVLEHRCCCFYTHYPAIIAFYKPKKHKTAGGGCY